MPSVGYCFQGSEQNAAVANTEIVGTEKEQHIYSPRPFLLVAARKTRATIVKRTRTTAGWKFNILCAESEAAQTVQHLPSGDAPSIPL